jgi:hypothetical protein
MRRCCTPLTIVPGTVRLGAATRQDFAEMTRHHYRSAPPATYCVIRGAWFQPHRTVGVASGRRLIAVAVLSWPVPLLKARLRHFPAATEITSLGVAGLMSAMWLSERSTSRTREEQLTAAHVRVMGDRIQLDALVEIVQQNAQAMTRLSSLIEQAGKERP